MYTIGDFLIRIKNGYMARLPQVDLPYSKSASAIGDILVKEGYLSGLKKNVDTGKPTLVAELKYKGRMPALTDVHLISKPSLHKYISKQEVKKTLHEFGISIISTSQGVMTNRQASEKNLGGELVCKIM